MNTTTSFNGTQLLARAGVVAVVAITGLPALASAASYAYVNQAGEVNLVIANDPTTAIVTAPNIAVHSGVMLLTDPSDDILGDDVSGV